MTLTVIRTPIIIRRMSAINRRMFLQTAMAGAAAAADPSGVTVIRAAIEKRHDESIRRLQEWIRQPSIAAEHRGMTEGCELTMRFLREAGFDQAMQVPTDRQPGIFANLDAGAPRTMRV